MQVAAKVNRRNRAALFLGLLAAGVSLLSASAASGAQTAKQKETAPKQAPHKNAITTPQTFEFSVVSVELEKLQGGGFFYLVEGTTTSGQRFVLGCTPAPPSSALKYHTAQENLERITTYENIEQFRQMALALTGFASLKKETAGLEHMTLYSYLLAMPDETDLTMRAAQGDEAAKKIVESLGERRRRVWEKEPETFLEALAKCSVISRIQNAEDLFSLTVLSSESQIWAHGTGYEVKAQTETESVTLGCTQGKGQACQSLPPRAYRAIRRESLVGIYDEHLKLIGIYRILSERSK